MLEFQVGTSSDAGNEIFASSGTNFIVPAPWSGRDHDHATLILRSPPFKLLPMAPLSFDMTGGQGVGNEPGALPASPRDLADGTTDGAPGVQSMGVGLLDLRTGRYVLVRQRQEYGRAFLTESFSQEELAPFVGGYYTLDLFDSFAGIWGWVGLDTVSIPGAPATFVDGFESGDTEAW